MRRTFENMFQVDTSLHPGNSGGPFIDARGRVVGLATIVAVGWAKGPVPVATPLSDIGLILPITKAAIFLDEIRAGKIKWDRKINVSLEQRLQRITDTARRREWEKARDLATHRSLLKKLQESRPGNSDVLIAQAYYAAMDEDWKAALDYSRQFLARPGRTNAGKLSVGLLEPEILNKQGETAQALERLVAYRESIDDPWYRALSGCLLDIKQQADVSAKAGESPENLLTGHTALGLWAEGSGDEAGAIRHYREALMSYMDNRIEYDFAMVRVKRLRGTAE